MVRAARAGRNASAWFTGLVFMAVVGVGLSAVLAPAAFGQGGGFGAQISPIQFGASAFPTDWQRTNSLANMQVFNGTQETVSAEIKVTMFRDGVQVATTPNVVRIYPNGNFTVPTYDLTQWQTLGFSGKVGDAVDMTGHLPDGYYSVCIDITNVTGMSSGAQYNTVTSCGQFLAFYPKPPTLVFPEDGAEVSSPTPIFQWTPITSALGRQFPINLRLVEVYPGQTPQRAIEANRAIYEQPFNIGVVSSWPYPTSAPPLIEGHRYAWRVQALYSFPQKPQLGAVLAALPGGSVARAAGENEGRSKVFTFTYTTHPGAPAGVPGATLEQAPESRMGSVWGPGSGSAHMDGGRSMERPRGGSMARRVGGVEGGAVGDDDSGSEESGGSVLDNFADRLAHVMASLWKQGPGAATAVARSGGRRIPGAATEAGVPMDSHSARSSSETRIAKAPEGTVGSTPADGSAPASEPAATVVDTAEVQAAVSTPAATPGAPAESPGLGPGWARLHGTASLTGETYSRDGYGSPTRPDRSSRVVTGLSVGVLKDQMRIPVSALVSDDQVAFRQNINQVAVAPRFRWAGLTAGNFSPQFSSYTLADATILGAGFELAPKNWQVGFVSGRARKALLPTLEGIVTPQFERNVTAGRIGYGNPLTNSVEFSVMRATDDPGSIAGAESTLTLTPEGNTVYALKAQGLLPMRHIRAQVETAISRYDRDRRADAPSVDGRALGLQLFHETGFTRLGVKAEYLDGGFMTLGNSGITGDRVDFGVNARVLLFQGKLSLDGTAGARNDAVSAALAAETRRRNYALNTSWQPGPHFGADAQVSVFANESDAADSALGGASNTTRLYSFAPHTAWSVRHIPNTLSCSATLQKSENGGSFLDTKSLTLLGNWSAQVAAPFAVTFSGNYTKTDFDVAVIETSAFGPGFTLAAFRSKLLTNAQLQVTRSRTGNLGTDTDLTPRMEMRWEFAQRQALVLRANFRRYQYASPTTPEFNERLASLEYVTNL